MAGLHGVARETDPYWLNLAMANRKGRWSSSGLGKRVCNSTGFTVSSRPAKACKFNENLA